MSSASQKRARVEVAKEGKKSQSLSEETTEAILAKATSWSDLEDRLSRCVVRASNQETTKKGIDFDNMPAAMLSLILSHLTVFDQDSWHKTAKGHSLDKMMLIRVPFITTLVLDSRAQGRFGTSNERSLVLLQSLEPCLLKITGLVVEAIPDFLGQRQSTRLLQMAQRLETLELDLWDPFLPLASQAPMILEIQQVLRVTLSESSKIRRLKLGHGQEADKWIRDLLPELKCWHSLEQLELDPLLRRNDVRFPFFRTWPTTAPTQLVSLKMRGFNYYGDRVHEQRQCRTTFWQTLRQGAPRLAILHVGPMDLFDGEEVGRAFLDWLTQQAERLEELVFGDRLLFTVTNREEFEKDLFIEGWFLSTTPKRRVWDLVNQTVDRQVLRNQDLETVSQEIKEVPAASQFEDGDIRLAIAQLVKMDVRLRQVDHYRAMWSLLLKCRRLRRLQFDFCPSIIQDDLTKVLDQWFTALPRLEALVTSRSFSITETETLFRRAAQHRPLRVLRCERLSEAWRSDSKEPVDVDAREQLYTQCLVPPGHRNIFDLVLLDWILSKNPHPVLALCWLGVHAGSSYQPDWDKVVRILPYCRNLRGLVLGLMRTTRGHVAGRRMTNPEALLNVLAQGHCPLLQYLQLDVRGTFEAKTLGTLASKCPELKVMQLLFHTDQIPVDLSLLSTILTSCRHLRILDLAGDPKTGNERIISSFVHTEDETGSTHPPRTLIPRASTTAQWLDRHVPLSVQVRFRYDDSTVHLFSRNPNVSWDPQLLYYSYPGDFAAQFLS